MTRVGRDHDEGAPGVLHDQLDAIGRWATLAGGDPCGPVPPQGREERLAWARRREALAREADALASHALLPVRLGTRPRAVVVHRQDWFVGKVCDALTARGVDVVASAADGAEGCGLAVAEAPDLLVLELALPSMGGAEVTARVRHCSPRTVVVAQVPHDEDLSVMLAAGAAVVHPRRVPPADLAVAAADLLARAPHRFPVAGQAGGSPLVR